MNSFRDALLPLVPQVRAKHPIIRPISQVTMIVNGSDAFNRSIRESVAWLSNRARAILPKDAFKGVPFDTSAIVGANPTSALRIDSDQAHIWAARLEFDDSDVAQRSWVTELSVGQQQDRVIFGARLTQVTAGEDAPFVSSVPGIVRQIADTIGARIDGRKLTSDPWFIEDESEYELFETLLLMPARRLPIVAISHNGAGKDAIDVYKLAERLCAAAHVVVLAPEVSWLLTRRFGKAISVFLGAVRVYQPRFDLTQDNPYQHELIFADRFASDEKAELNLIHKILAQTFSGKQQQDIALRFEDVRQAVRANELNEAGKSGASAAEQLAIAKEQIIQTTQRYEENISAFQQLLDEAAERENAAELALSEVRAELFKMRSRVAYLQAAIEEKKDNFQLVLPNSYDDFEKWAETNLSGPIVILNKAIRDVDSAIFDQPEIFYRSLLLLRDFYLPMRLQQKISRAEFDVEANKLGLRETACFAQAGTIKAYPEYKIIYNKKPLWLDRHLKYGSGWDHRRMFRIYFCWDEEEKVVVIGRMLTHLDNENTN